jgi:HlyD family secretion protein
VDNHDKLLLPYLTANVHFILRRESNVLLVPNAALRWAPTSLAQVAPDCRDSGMTDPPGETNSPSPSIQKSPAQKTHQRTLWVLAGDFVRPLEVAAGISDGANTAVTADGLREGEEVVTGEIVAAGADVKNPFLPKIIRR